jgi:hypothetical protein
MYLNRLDVCLDEQRANILSTAILSERARGAGW